MVGRRRLLRALELLLLFFLAPLALIPFAVEVGRWLLPLLIGSGVLAALALVLLEDHPVKRLFHHEGVREALPGILLRLAIGGAGASAVVLLWRPELFLSFAKARPGVFCVVLVLYPVLSAWPQEIVFRAFFFQRYQALLRSRALLVAASAISFGLAHAFFGNWIAPALSTAGGLLFALTYSRTNSLQAATLEHALWGDLIFAVGLGRFFYGGAIGG